VTAQTPTGQIPPDQTPADQEAAAPKPAPQKPRRRRADRPAGPPPDAPESSPGSTAPSGKVRRTAGTPVKSSPLGRKQKPRPAVAPASPPVDLGKPEPEAEKVDEADTAPAATDTEAQTESGSVQSFGSASVTGGVSYRDRRGGGRKPEPRKRRIRAGRSAAKSSSETGRSRRGRANLRGLGIVLAAVVSIGLIAGMVVASTLFILGTNKIDDRNELRAEYSAFARQMITNLTTLNPENIDGAIKTFQDSTSGKAMEQTSQSMEQTVNMIKSENVSTKGTVISEAVTASDANTGTVILVSSWEMNQPNVPEQQTVLQTFRWKLEMTRINGQLKLTNFEWVT